jgi:hypothetical protein
MMAFDDKALEALKRKYLNSPGGEIFDPKFKKVGEKIFNKAGTRVAPYAGLPTLLDAPYLAVDAENPDFGDLQVAMIDGSRRYQPSRLPFRTAGAKDHRARRPL